MHAQGSTNLTQCLVGNGPCSGLLVCHFGEGSAGPGGDLEAVMCVTDSRKGFTAVARPLL